ncbi:MAG TPA: DEAD/DEAH box helicase [Vicinamibacterales bacterium]|nr:DEAD/DEAH box helicase [Vicinamibacterales bacterium]
MPFVSLGLSASLSNPLARLGYTVPTPVQAQSIPLVLAGRDLLAKAQTGTGKTAAFGLPMIERLQLRGGAAGRRRVRGLVLVPTRELAAQVHKSLVTYAGPANLRVTSIFGGVSIVPQKRELQRGTDIIVATPGRLIDHLEQRTVDLSAVDILTLDEADRMLDMGFLPPLRRILHVLPRERQTLLFSATISDDVRRLSADFTRDPARVDVSQGQVMAATVTHRVHPVSEGRKGAALAHVLLQSPGDQALVFCKTKRGSNRVGEALERAGVDAAVINGNKSQGARQRALGDFRAGRVRVLVATDIAARGLDIVQLPLVVNFDLPLVAADYVHRAGRTGRAGFSGNAVSLVVPADRHLLRDIQRLLPEPIEHVVLDGFAAPASGPSVPEAAPRQPQGRSRREFGGRPQGTRHAGRGPGRGPRRSFARA